MNEKGSLLVGLLLVGMIGSVILMIGVFALPRYTNLPGLDNNGNTNNEGSTVEAINQTENIKIKSNLKSLQIALLSFYSENGSYPKSLEDLFSYSGVSIETKGLVYEYCYANSAIVYYKGNGNQGLVFNYEQVVESNGSEPFCKR